MNGTLSKAKVLLQKLRDFLKNDDCTLQKRSILNTRKEKMAVCIFLKHDTVAPVGLIKPHPDSE